MKWGTFLEIVIQSTYNEFCIRSLTIVSKLLIIDQWNQDLALT